MFYILFISVIGISVKSHIGATLFAIDITDGCGLSNEVHCELLLKKNKVMLY